MLSLLLCLATGPREPMLLHSATKIMDIPRTWEEGVLTQGNYDWWSKDQIVAFQEDPSGMSYLPKQQLFNLRGKQDKGAVPKGLFHGSVDAFSPDRKLSTKQEWKGMQLTWTVFDVWSEKAVGSWTITSHTPQPQMDQDNGYWPPDVQWSVDGKSIYQLETWRDKTDFLLAQVTQRRLSDLSKPRVFPPAHTFGWDVGLIVHEGKALARQYNLDNAREFPLKEWDLASPGTTMKTWKLRAPGGRVFIDYLPSPDYTKAVWLMGTPSTKVGSMGDHGYPYYAVSLWTSDLHGSGMREVGAIPFPSKKSEDLMDYYQYFGGIEWNPDGKHVSFVYMRKLYWIGV